MMSQAEAVAQARQLISGTLEVDYGDFKRRITMYLNNLEGQLKSASSKSRIQQAKNYVLYDFQVNSDQEDVREHILSILGKIKES